MSSPGRHRFARRGLLSAVVGALACVVLAAPVYAFASRSTHIAIVPAVPPVIGPNQGSGEGAYRLTFGSSTATCPAGQHVLFGGYKSLATGMRRTANNAWTVDSFNTFTLLPDASNPPLTLYSYVYCGYGPVPSKATSTVVMPVHPGKGVHGSATARCPAGTVVVGGGFATSPGSAVSVTDLERVATDLWRVSAYLIVGTHAAITAIAYCGPGPAPKLESQTIKAGGTTTFVHATCGVGRQLVFGGAIVSGVGDVFLQTLRVPTKTKNTWAVTGYGGFGRPRSGKLTALAYCR